MCLRIEDVTDTLEAMLSPQQRACRNVVHSAVLAAEAAEFEMRRYHGLPQRWIWDLGGLDDARKYGTALAHCSARIVASVSELEEAIARGAPMAVAQRWRSFSFWLQYPCFIVRQLTRPDVSERLQIFLEYFKRTSKRSNPGPRSCLLSSYA